MWPFKRKPAQTIDPLTIVGVTLGWDLRPHLCFVGGYVLSGNADRILYPQYFQHGDWPTDPITGEKLPIAKE